MPTYEYGCTVCGQHIEVFQRFSEDPLTTCGVCGGALRKVFHPASIVFKGSGFYATDSRSSATSGPASKKEADRPSSSSTPSGSPSGSSGSDGGSSKNADGGSASKTGTTKEPSSS
jgi:putative FmdB family regulatory protein